MIVVITGSVDFFRRDFKLFESAAMVCERPVKFIFLGRCRFRELIVYFEKLKGILPSNISIEYFSKFIEAKLFDDIVSKADIILNHSNPAFYFDGRLINSGVVEAFRFNKPLIMNEKFDYYRELDANIFYYADAKGLGEILDSWDIYFTNKLFIKRSNRLYYKFIPVATRE